MPAIRRCVLLLWCGLSTFAPSAATAASSTNAAASLRDEWIDPDTGHKVVRLSRLPGNSESFYFHQNAFTPQGDKMVFVNRAPGEGNRLCALTLATRQAEPITESGVGAGLVSRTRRCVYYQRSGAIWATDLDTKETRRICQASGRGGVSTINADDTLMAGGFTEPGGPPIDRSGPRSGWFEQIFEAKQPMRLYTTELASGKTNEIYRYEGWINHFQFSPTEPHLLLFCHEGPWHKLDRIWLIRTDGTGLKLVHARSIPMEIAGHEFWSHDGKAVWFDLQVPRGEKFFIAGVDLAGSKETRYELDRDQWSVHYNISWDGKLFAGDGGAPNMVAHATNGKWIYLFTPQPDGKLRAERLVNMSKHDYSLEPNVNFTPDGKWIVFRGNFDGRPQVYAVEVAKAGAAS